MARRCARAAQLLHAEARDEIDEALRRGPGWNGFSAQVEIASDFKDLTDAADAETDETC